MSTRPSATAEILFRFLDFSTLCRQEKFPSRYFRSVASVDGDAADFGTRPGASVGRRAAAGGRDSFRVSPFINTLQAGKFPSRATMRFSSELPSPFVSRGAHGRPCARVPHLVASRPPRPYHFRARIQSFQVVAAPFPGNSVRRWQCGPFRNEARCFHRLASCARREAAMAIEFGHRRDPQGDGTNPSRNRGLVGERAARNGQSRNARAWAGSEPRTTIGYDNMNFVLRKGKF